MRSIINLAGFFSAHPLTRDARLKAWGRFVRWQIKSRLNDEVVVPWVEGTLLSVRRGMTGATGNIYVGLHEFEDMMMVLHFLREGDLFLDVGANVGSYTVLASGVCKARTWAFEPDPNAAQRLKRNVAINAIDALVAVHEFALGSEPGDALFTVGLDTTNRISERADIPVRAVRLRRLDDLIGTEAPAMMKIDVEGYELHVLRGAERLLQNSSMKVVELETVSADTERLMTSHAFVRAYYDPFRRHLSKMPTDNNTAFNALYVRDWPTVVERLITAPKHRILDRLL